MHVVPSWYPNEDYWKLASSALTFAPAHPGRVPTMTGVKRLCAVTQYVDSLAKLVERPYLRGSQYRHLFIQQRDFKDVPGVNLDHADAEGDWLRLDRLTRAAVLPKCLAI